MRARCVILSCRSQEGLIAAESTVRDGEGTINADATAVAITDDRTVGADGLVARKGAGGDGHGAVVINGAALARAVEAEDLVVGEEAGVHGRRRPGLIPDRPAGPDCR